nr:Gag-Pol polyprotein [Tanacetum cinerariifolium]
MSRKNFVHDNPLPSIDSVVSELLAEEVRLKSHDDKKIVEPSVFASMCRTTTSTSIENRPHFKVAMDECSYCKQKGHWKSQCLNIPKGKPQTPQNWPPQQQRPSQPNNGVAAPSLDQSLIEQFQKFLAFQPQALATSSSNGSSSS